MIEERSDQVPFQPHIELLQLFVAHRAELVERIQGLLNAQRKPSTALQDRPALTRDFEDCFFTLAALSGDQRRLRRRLEDAYQASGFRPRHMPELHNDLVAPAELMARAFHLWQQTRWPGRNGRVRYAHTLFNVYVLRWLELLSLRLWDTEPGRAGHRLTQLQRVLDALWRSSPGDQPVLVRDARWLIPLAQSPTTDELAAYFEVAEQVAETLAETDRIEIQKAHAQMIAGHLRSQIRHYCTQDGVSLDAPSVVLRTRTSNALDFALLVQCLASLLEAYDRACHSGDARRRLELAGAVCQSISPDPELFLNRVDLLGPYSMIEYLFIAIDRDERAAYTAMGRRHIQLFRKYETLIGRLAKPLHDDCGHFRPVDGSYSPYGAIYGTPTHLTEDMALKAVQPDSETRFGLEDVFADGDARTDELAWISSLRKLPHIDRDVQRLYTYPQQFAEDIFERIEHALRKRAADGEAGGVARTGRLFLLAKDGQPANSAGADLAELPARFVASSDEQLVAAQKAHWHEEARLLRDRQEGYYLASYATPRGWAAIRKDMLTEVIGAGRDAKTVGLPAAAIGVLSLMCPAIAVDAQESDQASAPPSILNA